jgi:asparagine synthase (glutamine-hydrolysing)
MCGILGYYNVRRRPVARTDEEVARLRDMMTHRGPDDAGLLAATGREWILAHRRLSILDLSPLGHQPMSDDNGRIHICYNGEIYNFQALRDELQACGYVFRSTSDTEVILNLYKHLGEAFLSRLVGMFALIIVDENRGRALIARDPAGEKPLLYARLGDNIVIASDPGVISRDRAYERRVSPQGLYEALTMGGVKSPNSLYAGMRKLEPGHYRIIDTSFDFEGPSTRWFSYQANERHTLRTDTEAIAELDALLDRSVAQRMISDVPFGVYLSGGIDSALILAYMSQYTDSVYTFSIDPVTAAADRREVAIARDIASQFRTNHHTVELTEDEYIETLDEVLFRASGLAMPDCVLIFRLSQLARKNGVIVIETGEGADETFMGYAGYLGMLDDGYSRLARRNRTASLVARAGRAFGPGAGKNRWAYMTDTADKLSSGLLLGDFLYQPFFSYQADRITRRYLGTGSRRSKFAMMNAVVESMPTHHSHYAPSTLSLMWNAGFRWSDFLLERIDRHTMAASIEGRAPFLDPDVINFGLRIGDDLKVQGTTPKYILRKIAEKRVSVEHAQLPKRGFGGGNESMLGPRVCAFMRDKLARSASYRDTPLIKMNHLTSSSQLFTVASFHAWTDNWM